MWQLVCVWVRGCWLECVRGVGLVWMWARVDVNVHTSVGVGMEAGVCEWGFECQCWYM